MKWLKHSKKFEFLLIILQIVVTLTLVHFLSGQLTVARASSTEVNLEAQYTIQIRDGGVVITKVLINLRNDGTELISSLSIGLPKNFEQNLDDVVAYEKQELNISKPDAASNDEFWVEVRFADSVEQGQTIDLSIFFVFSKLITYDQSSPTIYTVAFPAYPVLPFDVARCEVEVELPEETTVQESSLSDILTEVKSPLIANSSQVGNITFTGDIRILECNSSSSAAILDSWGNLYFYNSYKIRNIGRTNVRDIVLTLPQDAHDVSANDTAGSLDVTITALDNGKEAKISLRYPLRDSSSVDSYDTYSFTIRYRVDNRAYIASAGSLIQYRFSYRLISNLNFTIKNLGVRIILPEGARHQSASIDDVSVDGLTSSLAFVFKNIHPVSTRDITVEYDYIFFWAAFRPTLWVGGLAAVIGVFVLHRTRSRVPAEVMPDKNIRLLRSFTDVCDERLMLRSDLDTLEEDLDNKRIRKKDYNRRKRITQQRLRALDKVLTSSKSAVRQLGPRYADLISRMERSEAEILVLRSNIDRFRAQYRSGRLSKRSYNELKSNYERRADRVKRDLESIIIEFRRGS